MSNKQSTEWGDEFMSRTPLCGGHKFDYKTGMCPCGLWVGLWVNHMGPMLCSGPAPDYVAITRAAVENQNGR